MFQPVDSTAVHMSAQFRVRDVLPLSGLFDQRVRVTRKYSTVALAPHSFCETRYYYDQYDEEIMTVQAALSATPLECSTDVDSTTVLTKHAT